MTSQRWQPICQDCWQAATPDQYWPGDTGFDTCASCGNEALILNAHPETVREAQRAVAPFVVEVKAVGEAEYVRNGLTFPTLDAARTWGSDLLWRWLGAESYRVVDTRTGAVVAS
jgi:hypothetical protein